MSLLNWGGGLAAMGNAISSFAGNAGLNEQKSELEQQQLQLANDLATGRDEANHQWNERYQKQAQDFSGTQTDKTIKAASDLETVRQNFQGTQTDKTIAAAATQGDATRKNALAIASLGSDDVSPIDKPFADKDGKMWQSWDDGSVTPLKDESGAQITGTPKNAVGVATLSPETMKLRAEQALAGDPAAYTGLGFGNAGAANRAALYNEITNQASDRGITGDQLAAINAEFFGTKAGERALGTRSANLGLAANEFLNMAPLALDTSAKVDRGQYPNLNALELALAKGTGDESVVRAMAATNSLVNIYARAINPTGVPTDSDKAHARNILDLAWSKGQYGAAVDQLQKEIGAARNAPGAVRDELRQGVTGRTPAPGASGAPLPAVPAPQSVDDLLKKYGAPQ